MKKYQIVGTHINLFTYIQKDVIGNQVNFLEKGNYQVQYCCTFIIIRFCIKGFISFFTKCKGQVSAWYRYIQSNKPAAQAVGADPSRCNSTNRQNRWNFWTNYAIVISFDLLRLCKIVYFMVRSRPKLQNGAKALSSNPLQRVTDRLNQ